MKKIITRQTLFVFIVALIAGFALLHQGLLPTHDGEYHVVRFYEFDKALRDGNLFPRWASDLNYGYGIPLFSYVYPLPNYFASFLHAFGISFIDAFKLNMFTAILLAGFSFYLWAKSFFDEKGALVGTVFYLFSPYFFVDTYIRGSVGEVWALALFPAFLWVLTKVLKDNKNVFLPITALVLGLIILSHNILALIFFPFAIVYGLLLISSSKQKIVNLLKLIVILLIGLGFASIFWIPAILETKFTVGLQIYDYKSNFVDLYQLIAPSWGSGFYGGGLGDQMSVQIGIANLLAVFLAFIVLFKFFRKKDYRVKLIVYFIISFFLVALLMLQVSLPVWKVMPLFNYFQFPWRFLSLEILICSFLAAGVAYFIKQKVFWVIILVSPIILGFNYAHPAYYMDRADSYYMTRSNFIDGTNSIGNVFNTLWFKAKPVRMSAKIESNQDVVVNKSVVKSSNYQFVVTVSKPSMITLNTAYFPGWEAKIDSKVVQIQKNNEGLIVIPVLKGKHSLGVDFGDTPIRAMSAFISLISFIVIVTLIIKTWYIRGKHEDSN